MSATRRVTAPGRVNLIGEHTDYNQGLALPFAVDLGTTVEFTPNQAPTISVYSTHYPEGVTFPYDLVLDPSELSVLEPPWARLVASMIALVRPDSGGLLRLETTLPIGAGMASSAALLVGLAAVFGVEGTVRSIAHLCQQAETVTGVPVGIMDPLACAGGRAGHALLVDFSTQDTVPVPMPEGGELVVVDSGERRALRFTGYAARVAECEAAAVTAGPLGRADADDVQGLRDPVLRKRARHVVTECARVRRAAEAMRAGSLADLGDLLSESHRSLADDFEVSTPGIDELVARLDATDGVLGARITGAGFGGCVLALTEPGAIDLDELGLQAWRVVPVDGTVTAATGGGDDGDDGDDDDREGPGLSGAPAGSRAGEAGAG